jgi:hypothetical protein
VDEECLERREDAHDLERENMLYAFGDDVRAPLASMVVSPLWALTSIHRERCHRCPSGWVLHKLGNWAIDLIVT